MKRTRIAAFALASALLALPAGAEWVDSEWWNVDFTDQTPGDYHQVPHPNGEGTLEYGGVEFEQGTLNGVTNVSRQVDGAWRDHQPYASGVWKADPTDESYVTNGVVTNVVGGVETEWDLGNYLELSTQGNEITWEPTNATPGLVNLVDARLRLVGSDSAPEISDFDPTGATHRVQAAIYLKNELDADTGETTNSVLCVYSRNTGTGKNEWMDLKAKNNDLVIEDGTWHRVQVSIDYTGDSPIVAVKVDGKEMVPVSGASEITAANPTEAKTANKVQEVCFRGTGAIDNFVGTTREDVLSYYDFTAEVYTNGLFVAADSDAANKTVVMEQQASGTGSTVVFEGFTFDNWISTSVLATWALSSVDVISPLGVTNTYTYTYNKNGGNVRIAADQPDGNPVTFLTRKVGAITRQTGAFTVEVPTEGANDDMTVVKIYFKTIGLFTVYGETYVDNAVELTREQKNGHIESEVAQDDFDQLEFPTSFTTNDTTYVLKSIPTNANPAVNAPALSADGQTVYVDVDLYGLSDDVVVNAYYEEGSLDGKVIMKNPDATNGAYTFFGAVAMIDGDPEPAYFPTLQGAIDKCLEGQTVTMIADVRTTSETAITNTVVLDLNGFTITAGNTNARRFKVYENGDLTLTNSVPETGAIVSDEFLLSNTGCCLIRVDGTFTMNGGAVVDTVTIPVDVDNDGEDDDAYVANAVAAFGTAVVTINDGSITASGYAISLNGSAAGENYSNGASITINGGAITATMGTAVYVPAGSVTVNGGTLTGLDGVYAKGGRLVFPADSTAVVVATAAADEIYDWEAMYGGSNLTGDALTLDNSNYTYGPTLATIAGGTFVSSNAHAVACYAVEGATMGSKFVTGGWFSDQVAADYVADGYQCVQDADNAPNADATYTVKAAAVQLWDAETEANVGSAQLSIADAVAVAVDNGVDVSNRVFVIIRPLAAETYLIGSTDELFTVQTTNEDYTANLTVGTSLESTDALVYTVTNYIEIVDPVYTTTWGVRADAYVAKIVNEDTTVDRFKTFEAAADVAVAYDSTVVMVADDRATTYTLEDGESLSVEEGLFAVPTVVPATLAEYYIVETVDGGITTYTSTNYLTATFLDGDNTTLDTVTGIRVGEAPATNSVPTPTKASEQAGHEWVFTGWTPSVETAITADQTYTPLFEDALVEYTLAYVTNDLAAYGASLPEGTANPTTFTIETETFALVAPVGYDTNDFAFVGWFVPGTDTRVTEVAQGTYDDIVVEPVFDEFYEIEFVVGNETKTTNVVEGAQIEYPYGTPELPDNAGWRFAFDGWSTNGVKLASLPVADQMYTFVALFTSNAIEYALVVDIDGEQNEYPDAGWGAIYVPPQSYTVEDPDITIPNPTNSEDYVFAGWLLTELDGLAVDGAQPTDTLVIPHGSTGARTYLALWDNVWKVGFTNGRAVLEELATNVVDGTQLAAPAPAADPEYTDAPADGYEYHFAGWALPGSDEAVVWPQTITHDVSYHAVFTSNAVAYTLAFDLNSETAGWGAIYTPPLTYTVEDEDISIPAPTNTPALTFTGWRLDSLDGEAVDGAPAENPLVIAKGSTGNRAYVAVWEAAPQDPEPVDVGRLIVDGDNVEPVEIVGTTFKARFHAPQAGVTYQLVESTVVNPADWTACPAVGNPVTSTAAEQIITLEAPMGTAPVKFYKIKATFPSAGN